MYNDITVYRVNNEGGWWFRSLALKYDGGNSNFGSINYGRMSWYYGSFGVGFANPRGS